MGSFLDKYTSVGQTSTKKPPLDKDEGYKKWKSDNARTLIDGININHENVGVRTMRVLNKLNHIDITPDEGQQLRVRTQSELNMIGVVIGLLQDKIADEVIICTYSLNKEALDTLCAMVKSGTIINLSLVIASSISYRDPEHKIHIIDRAISVGFKLAFVYSHLKITLIKTTCGKHYQSEGSMNYSRNNSAENLIIEENKQVYDHDRIFILETMISSGHKAVEIIR